MTNAFDVVKSPTRCAKSKNYMDMSWLLGDYQHVSGEFVSQYIYVNRTPFSLMGNFSNAIP